VSWPRRSGLSRPPIGAVWGWVQTVAGRTITDSLLPGGALVLSPHQDDETIGCGLLIAEKANRGIPVAVAVATDGRDGWYSPKPRPAPDEIAAIRHREWHRALDILAVPPARRFEFGFPDGELSDHESEVADRIRDLFRSLRPSQVFVTSSGDPHPDHRTLERAVRHAMAQIDDSAPGVPHSGAGHASSLSPVEPRPQAFIYRVYPGEGIWPDGRPPLVTVRAAIAQIARSIFGLAGRRPLLLRAPGSVATKVAAIDAYDSQRRLLNGELRYVWSTGVELYWAMDGPGLGDTRGQRERST
jgi:LmbE family N-acetylglucosaminyl deacetylase